jgi:hypothetical protein
MSTTLGTAYKHVYMALVGTNEFRLKQSAQTKKKRRTSIYPPPRVFAIVGGSASGKGHAVTTAIKSANNHVEQMSGRNVNKPWHGRGLNRGRWKFEQVIFTGPELVLNGTERLRVALFSMSSNAVRTVVVVKHLDAIGDGAGARALAGELLIIVRNINRRRTKKKKKPKKKSSSPDEVCVAASFFIMLDPTNYVSSLQPLLKAIGKGSTFTTTMMSVVDRTKYMRSMLTNKSRLETDTENDRLQYTREMEDYEKTVRTADKVRRRMIAAGDTRALKKLKTPVRPLLPKTRVAPPSRAITALARDCTTMSDVHRTIESLASGRYTSPYALVDKRNTKSLPQTVRELASSSPSHPLSSYDVVVSDIATHGPGLVINGLFHSGIDTRVRDIELVSEFADALCSATIVNECNNSLRYGGSSTAAVEIDTATLVTAELLGVARKIDNESSCDHKYMPVSMRRHGARRDSTSTTNTRAVMDVYKHSRGCGTRADNTFTLVDTFEYQRFIDYKRRYPSSVDTTPVPIVSPIVLPIELSTGLVLFGPATDRLFESSTKRRGMNLLAKHISLWGETQAGVSSSSKATEASPPPSVIIIKKKAPSTKKRPSTKKKTGLTQSTINF